MRVAFVLGTTSGGTGRHVLMLVEGLVRRGHQVLVVGPRSVEEQFSFGDAGARFAEVTVSDRPHPVNDLRAVLAIRRLTQGADIVHAHGLRAGALAALGRRGPVVTLHNALTAGGFVGLVYGVLERIVARWAGQVLTVSPDLAERMRRLGARDVRTALVAAPVPRPARRTPQEVRDELGAGDRPILLTVARLAQQKGLETLLDVAAGPWPTGGDASTGAPGAGDGGLTGVSNAGSDESAALGPGPDGAAAPAGAHGGLAGAPAVGSDESVMAPGAWSNGGVGVPDVGGDESVPRAGGDVSGGASDTPGDVLGGASGIRGDASGEASGAVRDGAVAAGGASGTRGDASEGPSGIRGDASGGASGAVGAFPGGGRETARGGGRRGRAGEPLFVVAGEGPLRGELQRRIDAEGLPVVLLGNRDDVPDLLGAAVALVMPSRWEGQPLTLREALMTGTPAIASEVGGIPEILGDAGILVPYGDVKGFREAVRQVLESPGAAKTLAEAATRRGREMPGSDDAVTNVLGVYRA
ncbi:glycosyltransferase family 4 protein [[Actinomadura] parvosata]|uniref:glycosyltransferase family 4 protein n=1 Tax=[Actinomadura] parvosata TaxID=1955412 RepID=UPI00406CC172